MRDELKKSQDRLAAAGIAFTTENARQFPLAGGDLGEKLSATDKSVARISSGNAGRGYLQGPSAYRFGLVATERILNLAPQSVGWISGVQANPTWFAPSGDVEPSRLPMVCDVIGPGGPPPTEHSGPTPRMVFPPREASAFKSPLADWRSSTAAKRHDLAAARTSDRLRHRSILPMQENRMTPEAGPLGSELFAGKNLHRSTLSSASFTIAGEEWGADQFVASTHTLENGREPSRLIVADGF